MDYNCQALIFSNVINARSLGEVLAAVPRCLLDGEGEMPGFQSLSRTPVKVFTQQLQEEGMAGTRN